MGVVRVHKYDGTKCGGVAPDEPKRESGRRKGHINPANVTFFV